MQVTIRTATVLTSKQLNQIKTKINKKYGSKVEYVQRVDPNLIGGISLTIASKEFDASVKGKLDNLKDQLKKAF